jgi:integrase
VGVEGNPVDDRSDQARVWECGSPFIWGWHVFGLMDLGWCLGLFSSGVFASDVEAFLVARPGMRARHLSVLRQFFASARRHKIMLADPSRGIPARRERGFSGRTITIDDQRGLFRRWTTGPAVHPHEALLGLLGLLHGAASREVRLLRLDDVDTASRSIRLGQRPHPVPLDPASWAALQRCPVHREQLRTDNPHVVVTRGTKVPTAPASIATSLMCWIRPESRRTGCE